MKYVPIAERVESGEVSWLGNFPCGGKLVIKGESDNMHWGMDKISEANHNFITILRGLYGEEAVFTDVAIATKTHERVPDQIGVYILAQAYRHEVVEVFAT